MWMHRGAGVAGGVRVADLGCGTGLVGKALRDANMAAYVAGVDLAPKIVDQARQRAVYDRLDVGDAVEWLEQRVLVGDQFDLVVAADVLPYLGAVEPLMRATSLALGGSGHAVLSTEALGEEVLVERSQMVELDRRRNLNREALAALRQSAKVHGAEAAGAQKRWICLGDVFVRHSSSDAKAMLEADQARIEQEMEVLRKSVKRKTSKLCEIDPSIAQGSNVHRTFVDLVGVSAGELEGMISNTTGSSD